MTWEVADRIYQAGFHSIDYNDEDLGTPLMNVGFTLRGGRPYDTLRYMRWLISRGADVYRRVPRSTASALHQLCRNIGKACTSFTFAGPGFLTHGL